jgi:predicted ester cyclase
MHETDLVALTREGFERIFNQGDLDHVDRTLDPAAVDHQEQLGAAFPAHLKQVATMLRTAFPDLRFEIQEMIREGDTVASRSLMTGTHEGRLPIGPMAEIEPHGASISVQHMHFFHYTGDRLSDLWHVWDEVGLVRQMQAPAQEPIGA